MRLTSAELDTVILKCRECHTKKKALWFRLLHRKGRTYETENICAECFNLRYNKHGVEPEVEPEPEVEIVPEIIPEPELEKIVQRFRRSKPGLLKNMYKAPDTVGDSIISPHTLKFRHKKYIKAHLRVQNYFSHLAKKNLDIDDPADTIKCMAEIEKYRSKHELSKTV